MFIHLTLIILLSSITFASEYPLQWTEEPVGVGGTTVPGIKRFKCKIENRYYPIELFVESHEFEGSAILWQDFNLIGAKKSCLVRASFKDGKLYNINVPEQSLANVNSFIVMDDIPVPVGLEGKIKSGDNVLGLYFKTNELEKTVHFYFKVIDQRFELIATNP
jgi:hypothetical protein